MANNFGTFLGALNVGRVGSSAGGSSDNELSQNSRSWRSGFASTISTSPAVPSSEPAGVNVDVEAVGKQVLGVLTKGGFTAEDLGTTLNMQTEQLLPVLDYLEKSHMINYVQADAAQIVQLTDFASEALRMFHFS